MRVKKVNQIGLGVGLDPLQFGRSPRPIRIPIDLGSGWQGLDQLMVVLFGEPANFGPVNVIAKAPEPHIPLTGFAVGDIALSRSVMLII